jgi:hypothetical protein
LIPSSTQNPPKQFF